MKNWMLSIHVNGKEVVLMDSESTVDQGIKENLEAIESCAFHIAALVGKIPIAIDELEVDNG